jgi:hypothetical protein
VRLLACFIGMKKCGLVKNLQTQPVRLHRKWNLIFELPCNISERQSVGTQTLSQYCRSMASSSCSSTLDCHHEESNKGNIKKKCMCLLFLPLEWLIIHTILDSIENANTIMPTFINWNPVFCLLMDAFTSVLVNKTKLSSWICINAHKIIHKRVICSLPDRWLLTETFELPLSRFRYVTGRCHFRMILRKIGTR